MSVAATHCVHVLMLLSHLMALTIQHISTLCFPPSPPFPSLPSLSLPTPSPPLSPPPPLPSSVAWPVASYPVPDPVQVGGGCGSGRWLLGVTPPPAQGLHGQGKVARQAPGHASETALQTEAGGLCVNSMLVVEGGRGTTGEPLYKGHFE